MNIPEINSVYYNDTGGWEDDPIYMVCCLGDKGKDSVTVFTLEDKVMISGIYGEEHVSDEINQLVEYLRSIPFEERVEKIKNIHKSLVNIKKFNLNSL